MSWGVVGSVVTSWLAWHFLVEWVLLVWEAWKGNRRHSCILGSCWHGALDGSVRSLPPGCRSCHHAGRYW